MVRLRILAMVVVAACFVTSTAAEKGTDPKQPGAPSADPQKPSPTVSTYEARFGTNRLIGGPGAVNRLSVHARPEEFYGNLRATIAWPEPRWTLFRCSKAERHTRVDIYPPVAHPDRRMADWSAIAVHIPSPPCWWPYEQTATLKITGNFGPERAKATPQDLFNDTVDVSIFWLPLLITLLAVAIIYPGCAMAAWYAKLLRYRRNGGQRPRFLSSLDPVDLTTNAYGRPSVAKLQIFLFTIIVFGLLLFNVLRSGDIANTDASRHQRTRRGRRQAGAQLPPAPGL
jgi:hypothetical protein